MLYEAIPHFADATTFAVGPDGAVISSACRRRAATSDKAAFHSRRWRTFYLTNPIARASAVMAECSALARGSAKLAAE